MLVTQNEPLWRWQSGHNSLRRALHALRIVLLFFPVPPSLRQAAGPLTENLPNVLTGDPTRVDLSLQSPSPSRNETSSLFACSCPSPTEWLAFAVIEWYSSFMLAAAEKLTTKRGHLAEAAKSGNRWL